MGRDDSVEEPQRSELFGSACAVPILLVPIPCVRFSLYLFIKFLVTSCLSVLSCLFSKQILFLLGTLNEVCGLRQVLQKECNYGFSINQIILNLIKIIILQNKYHLISHLIYFYIIFI